MTLTKRERIIGIATAAVIGLLALDYVVYTPLSAARDQVERDTGAALLDLEKANGLFANGPRMNQRWHQMVADGLTADAYEAESRTLNALREWAQSAGLSLTSLKPDRTERKGQFLQVTLRATATGSMRSVTQFLGRVQSAQLPFRISDMQITARKEGNDDLLLQLGVSTLSVAPPEKEKPKLTAPGNAGGGSGRGSFAMADREVSR